MVLVANAIEFIFISNDTKKINIIYILTLIKNHDNIFLTKTIFLTKKDCKFVL